MHLIKCTMLSRAQKYAELSITFFLVFFYRSLPVVIIRLDNYYFFATFDFKVNRKKGLSIL